MDHPIYTCLRWLLSRACSAEPSQHLPKTKAMAFCHHCCLQAVPGRAHLCSTAALQSLLSTPPHTEASVL